MELFSRDKEIIQKNLFQGNSVDLSDEKTRKKIKKVYEKCIDQMIDNQTSLMNSPLILTGWLI